MHPVTGIILITDPFDLQLDYLRFLLSEITEGDLLYKSRFVSFHVSVVL